MTKLKPNSSQCKKPKSILLLMSLLKYRNVDKIVALFLFTEMHSQYLNKVSYFKRVQSKFFLFSIFIYVFFYYRDLLITDVQKHINIQELRK